MPLRWHSFHVRYHNPQDALLLNGIGPAVASHRDALDRWFFLRHWKEGPHIRVRLLVDDAATNGIISEVEARIGAYMAHHPSANSPDGERLKESLGFLAKLEGEDRQIAAIIPDNTLYRRAYEPEYMKYGGKSGVALAEKLFEQSSDLALQVLGMIQPARRLTAGFGMLLAGLSGAGLDERTAAGFLAGYYRVWSHYAPGRMAGWRVSLKEQQRALAACVSTILSNRLPREGMGLAIEHWKFIVNTAMEELNANAREILQQVTILGQDATDQQRRDLVLLNYLHTHNNRLGVIPSQEAYLAYAGHHIVCRLGGFTPEICD
jgi:thiopeptide-type bacteriocin biosynthesis protein